MKVVVLTALHPQGRALLEKLSDVVYGGWAITKPVVTPLPTDDEILALAHDAHGIAVPGELSGQVIAGCPDLRVIGVARGDPHGVDLAAATARRIPVVYAAGRNARAVAELTLAFILNPPCRRAAFSHQRNLSASCQRIVPIMLRPSLGTGWNVRHN